MRGAVFLAAALALGACARQVPDDTQAYIKAVQGSDDYRRGFSQGCETANLAHDHAKMQRDEPEFENNPEFRLGWVAGSEKCKDVTHVQPSAPSIRTFD